MLASQLYGVATVSSTVSFDPLTGTGTITFQSSYDTDKSINYCYIIRRDKWKNYNVNDAF
ncbi:hypothetical protein [Clostridium sp. CF012]|uniref:hypothetical protein n=1 Tax=Clostridium sp. CF012 TaxID=2843319 RepID=UPI001C0CD5EB|nr:hypothetical protein [Clostridium sp. CF012]MBU3146876.1 hypothetical protein [Clostridium sp. CF012]